MEHVQAFNDKLNEFRTMGKYCDINIKVGAKIFPIHKVVVAAASEYFDRILNERHNPKNESSTAAIVGVVLREDEIDDVHVFEEVVLPFIYTGGDVTINRNNVVKVLRMSALFALKGLEERCIRFITQNSKIPNILNLFTSVTSPTKKPSWIPLLSRYIMEHFDELCDDELMMEFSYEDFLSLLRERFFLSPNNEDTFLDTIIRWYHRCEEKRRRYFHYLIDSTNFPHISADYMKCLLKKFCLKTSSSSANILPSSPSSADDDERNDIKYRPSTSLGLHMYILDDDRKIRVYSANKSTLEWSVKGVIKELDPNDSSYSIASVGLDDYIYSLEYSLDKNTFKARPRVPLSPFVRSLKPPPVRMDSFDMCHIQEHIYVNNSCCSEDFDDIIMPDVDQCNFTKEQIGQRIFEYDTVVDKWCPVPLLDGKLDGSAVTAYNSVLYLVEGNMHPTSMTSEESNVNIRALDIRTSKWQTLTKNVSTHGGFTMLGCAHEGKIYVCRGFGEGKDPAAVGIYDLKANRWEKFQKMQYNYQIHQLLAYENYVWAFGKSARNDLCTIEVFNPLKQQWSQSPFSEVNCATEDGSKNFFFKNAFIFRSSFEK